MELVTTLVCSAILSLIAFLTLRTVEPKKIQVIDNLSTARTQ